MLALDEPEQRALKERGFLVSARHHFSTMLDGYASLYVLDLPVYISADSILDAVYRSYDAILRESEESALIPALSSLLDGMRKSLAARRPQPQGAKDVDFYLAVAKACWLARALRRSRARVRPRSTRSPNRHGWTRHAKQVIFGPRETSTSRSSRRADTT